MNPTTTDGHTNTERKSYQLTSYGPGKYNLQVDAYVHGHLEADIETGDCNTTGWYGLYSAVELHEDTREAFELSIDDVRYLRSKCGAIAEENSQGFVTVEYFDTADGLQTAWAGVEAEVSRPDGELCDTCGRSGVEVSHTTADGKTVCVECAEAEAETAETDETEQS